MDCGMNARDWTGFAAQETAYEFFEMFSSIAERHFRTQEPGEELTGKLILSCGMGRRGGVLPLSATMGGAAFLGIEADVERIKQRLKNGECDFLVNSLDEALRILKNAVRKGENLSVGLVGNCADLVPEMAARGVVPDIVTDQTSLFDAEKGYVPSGMKPAEARALLECDAAEYERRARESIRRHVDALLRLREMGSLLVDTGNGLAEAAQHTVSDAEKIPDFAHAWGAELAAEGGLLRWAALSGAASDRDAIDSLVLELFSAKPRLRRWIEQSRRIRSRIFAARIARLAAEEQRRLALAVNAKVREGSLRSAVVLQSKRSAGEAGWDDPVVADGSREAAERMEAVLRQGA
jgi:urocanate hydratase